jgi:hypothetical protein
VTVAAAKILHASRVEEECAYRGHQYGVREWLAPQRVPFLRGTAAHGAREYALRCFLDTKGLPSGEDVEAAAVDAVETRVEEDAERGTPTDPAWVTEALDEALPIVRADLALAIPEIAPHVLAIEEEIVAPIDGTEWSLSGRIDARGRNPVTGEGAIIDLKTGSPRDPQATADLSNQLSNYALLHRFKFGTIPTFALDHVWTMAKGPKPDTIKANGLLVCEVKHGDKTLAGVRRRIVTSRTPDALAAALRLLRFRIDAEEAGWHAPAYGGYGSPCVRCIHFAHEDPTQRCPWRPSTRAVPIEQEG